MRTIVQTQTVQPLEDYIAIEPSKRIQDVPQIDGKALELSDGAKDDVPIEGTIVAVGPGKTLDDGIGPMVRKPGERVLFGRYAGTSVSIKGVPYILVQQAECLMLLD